MRNLTFAVLAIGLLHAAITNGVMAQSYNVMVDDTGAAYPWIDTSGGMNVDMTDDDFESFTWPFDFTVYSDTYVGGTDMYEINSNGSVHFDIGGPRTDWVNCGEIPSTNDGQFVAVFGADLDPSAGGSVRVAESGEAPNRVLTVEWDDVPEIGTSGGILDLQLNFYEESNMIVSQYRQVSPPEGGDGVVGINLGDGITGQEVFCFATTGLPSAEFDVEYTLVPEPGSLVTGALGLLTLLFVRRRNG